MAGLSAEVDQVVLRALSKDPDQRYQTAEELALDVEKVIDLAPPHEVGAWLESVAGEILGKRERLLQEIERLGVGDVVFDSSGGSITDSDTFQRIQSWAEREAARAAGDAQAAFAHDLEDTEAEPTKTVADARCVDDVLPPDTASSVLEGPSSRPGLEPVAEALVGESRVARVEQAQPSSPTLADVVSGGTASGMVASVEPRRRERRWLYAFAAAAGVLGVAAATLIGAQPATRVSTNALLPESAQHVDESATAGAAEPANDGAMATVAANKPVADTDNSPIAGSSSRDTASRDTASSREGGREALGARVAQETNLRAPARGTASRPSLGAMPELDDLPSAPSVEAKNRVAQALTQPAKERAASSAATTPRRAPKRATVARRAKPAQAAAGASAAASPTKSGATKVDCRQPFWIDEGGIRRLKMACL